MIEIILGTSRPGANSRKVAMEVFDCYKKVGSTSSPQAGIPVGFIDLKDLPAQAFLPEAYEDRPRAIKSFSDRLLSAEGIHIVCPEYNRSFPGILKHFIDLWPFPDLFVKRKFTVTGVSTGVYGGINAVSQLEQFLANRNGFIYSQRVYVPNVEDLFVDGKFNVKTKEKLEKQVKGFLEFVNKLK